MIIRLLPGQIPAYWENIKFAISKTFDVVRDDDMLECFNESLNALLNEKAQCWIRTNEDNTMLDAIGITRLLENKFTNKKELYIQSLYSFKAGLNNVWESCLMLLKEYAKKEHCFRISCDTKNKRIHDVVLSLGFIEEFRHYCYKIGG